jgi:hypothetical protein
VEEALVPAAAAVVVHVVLVWCRFSEQQHNNIKGQCHEIFGFFHESVSPQQQSIPLGPFRIFSKIRGDIHKSRCTGGKLATSVNDTSRKFPPGIKYTGSKFATGINDTSGKFVDTGGYDKILCEV